MPIPVLAAAQCAIRDGDLEGNVALHLQFMQRAAELGVGLLLFPELSLTGYEPSIASALALPLATPLLAPLQALAQQAGMTTIVGLPLRVPGRAKPQIAACTLHPDGSVTAYTKQYLHAGEEQFFSVGNGGELLSISGQAIALSVCADFAEPEHAANAASAGADVYAASVLIGEPGYPHDSVILQGYAQQHGMAVLMANHGGPTGGWAAAGRSAFWDELGQCVASTEGAGNRLLVISRGLKGWSGVSIPGPDAGWPAPPLPTKVRCRRQNSVVP